LEKERIVQVLDHTPMLSAARSNDGAAAEAQFVRDQLFALVRFPIVCECWPVLPMCISIVTNCGISRKLRNRGPATHPAANRAQLDRNSHVGPRSVLTEKRERGLPGAAAV